MPVRTKFVINFSILDSITINFSFSISIPRWILLTDFILYNAPFMGFPTHRLRLSLPQVYFCTVNIDDYIIVFLLAAK